MTKSIYTNEFLLNLASRKAVAWAFIRLSSLYKFVGMFV
jgi:hypothetical protein